MRRCATRSWIWAWWAGLCPAFRTLGKEDQKFKATLNYTARPDQKAGGVVYVFNPRGWISEFKASPVHISSPGPASVVIFFKNQLVKHHLFLVCGVRTSNLSTEAKTDGLWV